MSANLDPPDLLRTWKADAWEEIHPIWSGLVKKYQDQTPTFRSIELDDKQAGWVFERSRPVSPESPSMSARPLRLMAENLPEHRILEAIFRVERENGAVRVSSYLTSSAAVGAAERVLMEHPEVPVALVLNAESEDLDTIADQRRTFQRILSRVAHTERWLVALAIPDVATWMMADPRIRQIFEADEVTRRSRYDRAVRIGDLARVEPIDREVIARTYPDFQALVGFIERHVLLAQPTT